MDYIRFQISRFFAVFANIFAAPGEILGIIWDGSGRSNSLVLGLPAVIIGVVGFCSVVLMQWGGTTAMVDNYAKRVESINNQQKRLDTELRQTLISKMSVEGGGVDSQKLQQLRAEDPKTQEIKDLGEQSLVYLKKLLDLEPDVKEHRYQLAIRYFGLGDVKQAQQLLKQIAPQDRPGHPEAHLQLARYYSKLPVRSALERLHNVDIALQHAGHCLTLDTNDLEALKLKARLLRIKGSKRESKESFERLFEDNPIYYQALLELNPTDAERAAILSNATSRYMTQLRKPEVRENTIEWVRTWEGLFSTMTQKKDFVKLRELLENDLKLYSRTDATASRVPFLKQYLCRAYLAWAISDVGDPLKTLQLNFTLPEQQTLLEYFTKAYSYNEKDRLVLQNIAKLGGSKFPEIAEAAKQLYDPATATNLSPGVLNQIALEALSAGRYSEAQEYYERAKTLNPNNPGILNNLAYAYLKEQADNPNMPEDEKISNASRAHRLVEEAIRKLPEKVKKSTQASMYRHTMGTALMQLGNYPGAAAQFEMALSVRPGEVELLKSVIECYELYDLDSSAYQRKLKEVLSNQDSASSN